MTAVRGHEAITRAFRAARTEERAALVPYLAVGYPTLEISLELADAAISGGADMLELGIPFSDPLADGPAIQQATQAALDQGATLKDCLETARRLRQRRPTIPLLFMGYVNPILAYGEDAFVRACVEAGVDGLIVPDLPPEEAETLEESCRAAGLALVYLVAPNTPRERAEMICRRATGFVYLVSEAGTTGVRDRLPDHLPEFVARIRTLTNLPIALGFGISTPEHAAAVARIADGAIVGSAIVTRCKDPDPATSVRRFVEALRAAVIREVDLRPRVEYL